MVGIEANAADTRFLLHAWPTKPAGGRAHTLAMCHQRACARALTHAGGEATVGRGVGAAAEAGLGRGGGGAARWGRGEGRVTLVYLDSSCLRITQAQGVLVSSQTQGVCVCAACPGARAAEGSGNSGRGNPSPRCDTEPHTSQPACTAFTAVFCSARIAGATPSCLGRSGCCAALWVRWRRDDVVV